jgi:hypothetical protein
MSKGTSAAANARSRSSVLGPTDSGAGISVRNLITAARFFYQQC